MLKRLTKDVKMTEELAQYVEELHATSEDKGFLNIADNTWEIEHSFLQIPLSEAKFLSLFVKALKAKKVLELGTFRGWSAAWIAKALPDDGVLTSVDHDGRNAEITKELWQKLGLTNKINFILKDGQDALKELKKEGENFDLIFIDAHKAEYKRYLDLSWEILNEGGVLLADNTLWTGLTAEDTTEPRANYMKDFNDYVFEKFGGQACLIPAWDGVVMVVK
jgi:O-methyltransferase